MRRVRASQLVDCPPLPPTPAARVVAPVLYQWSAAFPGAHHSDGASFPHYTRRTGMAGRCPSVSHPVPRHLRTPADRVTPHPGLGPVASAPGPLAQPASSAPITALINNLGGLPHQSDLLHSWVLVLHPDVLLLHETWDPDAVSAALQDHYQSHVSQVTGPGAGCVVAWRRAHVPAGNHTVLHDRIGWLAVLLLLASQNTALAVSVHFRPKLSSAAQRRHLQHIATLESATKPTLLLLGGDFNSAVATSTTLHTALSPRGCLGHAQRLLPDGTLTHFSRRGPVLTVTAIHHVFAAGAVSEAEAATFRIDSAHMAIPATIQLGSAAVDPFAWKRYPWTALPPEVPDRVVALLDVYWAFLALTPVAPDIYIAAAHAIADRTVPRRQQPKSELASLTPPPPPYSPKEIHALQTQVSQRARHRGYRSRADTLRTAAITGATRRALRLPTVPLQPFAGLPPSPDDQPVTRGSRLVEVSAQAAYVQENRWVRVDVRAVSDAASWEPWFTAFRLKHDLPMHLVLMLVRQANPTWSRAGTFAQEL